MEKQVRLKIRLGGIIICLQCVRNAAQRKIMRDGHAAQRRIPRDGAAAKRLPAERRSAK